MLERPGIEPYFTPEAVTGWLVAKGADVSDPNWTRAERLIGDGVSKEATRKSAKLVRDPVEGAEVHYNVEGASAIANLMEPQAIALEVRQLLHEILSD